MQQFPALNGHSTGIILKELVRRAIRVARSEMISFEVSHKSDYAGNAMQDVFTTADRRAQEVFVKSLQECFPGFGIIGEEDSLVIPPHPDRDAYFTIDPIDGTKAFIRRQSHGVGSMVALVVDGEVVSAYIGDMNSQEIFGYRPGSRHVWRITDLETFELLPSSFSWQPLEKLHLLMRDREKRYSKAARSLVNEFAGVSIDGGSIGIWAARLWKGEVGALLLHPSWETPWDSTPVIGISRTLGYLFLRPSETARGGWETYEPQAPREKSEREHDILIIHASHLVELRKAVLINGQ